MHCLVFQKLDMSVRDYIKMAGKHPIHTDHIRTMATDVLQALVGLRKIKIVHADLKTDNIMFVNTADTRNPFHVKVIDAGLARTARNVISNHQVGSLHIR